MSDRADEHVRLLADVDELKREMATLLAAAMDRGFFLGDEQRRYDALAAMRRQLTDRIHTLEAYE